MSDKPNDGIPIGWNRRLIVIISQPALLWRAVRYARADEVLEHLRGDKIETIDIRAADAEELMTPSFLH